MVFSTILNLFDSGGGRADAQLLDGGAAIMTVRILSLQPCVYCLWGCRFWSRYGGDVRPRLQT